MQEALVTFKTAKLAKEKGFNWKCRGKIHCSHYHLVKDNIIPSNVPTSSAEMFAPLIDWNNHLKPKLDTETSLPTQSLLQKWLREIYDIDVIINTYRSQGHKWYKFFISERHKDVVKSIELYQSYEEALEIGLQEALKLLQ